MLVAAYLWICIKRMGITQPHTLQHSIDRIGTVMEVWRGVGLSANRPPADYSNKAQADQGHNPNLCWYMQASWPMLYPAQVRSRLGRKLE